jgi:glycosyltransferase involved in cell wall biosynthesis
VLTVAIVNDMKTFYLKGIDKFIQCAGALSAFEFLFIGISPTFVEVNQVNLPENLRVLEPQPYDHLLEYYSEAKVFCLFSLSEGMPNVLCEAMLCECIPVGTNVTSIPEIIGDSGYVISERGVECHIKKLEEALKSELALGKLARKRVMENYSLLERERKIVSIIDNILS